MRIEGRVEKVSAEESDAYYQTRPLDSRIGAWAVAAEPGDPVARRAGGRGGADRREVPARSAAPAALGRLPAGADTFEFWQGRRSRLHDRLRYRLQADGSWLRERLAP